MAVRIPVPGAFSQRGSIDTTTSLSPSKILGKKNYHELNVSEISMKSEKNSIKDNKSVNSDDFSTNGSISSQSTSISKSISSNRPTSSHITKRQIASEHLIQQKIILEKLKKLKERYFNM